MADQNSLVPEWTNLQHRQAAVCLASTLRIIVGNDPRLLPLVQLHADVAWKQALGQEEAEYLMELVGRKVVADGS